MIKIPDRLYIDKDDKKYYDSLAKEIFLDKERKDQFLFALAIGFKNGINQPIKSREGFIRTEYLNSEDITLLNSIAIYHSGSSQILCEPNEIYKIAEEYAHAGIKIIFDEATTNQPGSIFKKFELELMEGIKAINLE